MFDIGFSEILVIAVVALVVLGPEKLPKTARTLGHLYGRLRRYVSEVQADITREMELDELRKLQQQVHSAAREIETSMTAAATEVQSSVKSLESELNRVAAGAADVAPTAAEPPATLAAPDVRAGGATDALPGAVAEGETPEPPRQASLPGLDRP
jgi:sec-independent protein translocase protein TatB